MSQRIYDHKVTSIQSSEAQLLTPFGLGFLGSSSFHPGPDMGSTGIWPRNQSRETPDRPSHQQLAIQNLSHNRKNAEYGYPCFLDTDCRAIHLIVGLYPRFSSDIPGL